MQPLPLEPIPIFPQKPSGFGSAVESLAALKMHDYAAKRKMRKSGVGSKVCDFCIVSCSFIFLNAVLCYFAVET